MTSSTAARRCKRSLTAWDLTLLGIGAIIGTGIFVLTGTAAANQAGPAITCPIVVAGLACGFAALCYAEFAVDDSRSPAAPTPTPTPRWASSFAWMIGWDLILEYAVGSMTVAIGWSGYMQKLLPAFGITLPVWMSAAPAHTSPGARHQPAGGPHRALIMVLLVVGVRESARFNAVMVGIKLAAVLFFIGVGVAYVKPDNWTPFMRRTAGPGVMGGRRRGLLRLHRLRRRLDHRRGSQEPAARPADRHHRVAGHLHGPVPGRGGRPHRASCRSSSTTARTTPRSSNAPVALRARALIGQDWAAVPGVGRRRRRHHLACCS